MSGIRDTIARQTGVSAEDIPDVEDDFTNRYSDFKASGQQAYHMSVAAWLNVSYGRFLASC